MIHTIRWWFFHPFSNWNVKRAAKKDALHEPPIPAPSTSDHPPFIRRLKQYADGAIRTLAQQWKKNEGKLKAKWHQAAKQLTYWTNFREKCEKDFSEALERFRKHSGLDIEDLTRGRKIGYWLIAAILCFIEWPINEFVFRALHESELVTAILAFAIGAILVLVGHHLGTEARERQYQGKYPLGWTAFAWIFGSLMIMAGVTWFRWFYFKRAGGEADMSWALLMVFFGLNFLILMAATGAAYRAHFPGEKFLVKMRSRIARAKAKIERLEEKTETLKTRGEHLREDLLRRAEAAKDMAQELHYLYYEQNLRGRSDISDYPSSFHTRLNLDGTIEKAFPAMNWNDKDMRAHDDGHAGIVTTVPADVAPPAAHSTLESVSQLAGHNSPALK